MAHDFCCWCHAKTTVPKNYDPKKQKAACSWSCFYAEIFFCKWYSDDEALMRHYWTKGG